MATGSINSAQRLREGTDLPGRAEAPRRPVRSELLAQFFEAGSEQRPPVYVGPSAREQALGAPAADQPVLPQSMQRKAVVLARELARALAAHDPQVGRGVELDAWPVQDEFGQRTWAFARYRTGPGQPWRWLDADALPPLKEHRLRGVPAEFSAVLPVTLRANVPADAQELFTSEGGSNADEVLYDKPLAGEAVWTDEAGRVLHAWLSPSRLAAERRRLEAERAVAHVIPQPALFNTQLRRFTVGVNARGQVSFPADLSWRPDAAPVLSPSGTVRQVAQWPTEFRRAYQRDVRVLSGEAEAVFPLSGRRAELVGKNNALRRNGLGDEVDYLEERYRALGLATFRHTFTWHGRVQENLVAVLPGQGQDHDRRPVLMADHIDTAFAEDVYDRTGQLQAVDGADDNASASAALLRAAEVLRGVPHKDDIWLLHLTGEEFPADSLGARAYVRHLVEQHQDIKGLVLMDMIGFHHVGDRIFQINAGESEESVHLASIAHDAAADVAQDLTAVFRPRFDPRSYLYNTDGVIFSDAGFPVVLLNEHINFLENLGRHGYHDVDDTTAHVDSRYASEIARVAIETAARLANE